jgi:dephospho-CoA kinase
MTPEQVRERAAAQLSDEERARVADVLLDNDGGLERLAPQVERLWNDLSKRAEVSR